MYGVSDVGGFRYTQKSFAINGIIKRIFLLWKRKLLCFLNCIDCARHGWNMFSSLTEFHDLKLEHEFTIKN